MAPDKPPIWPVRLFAWVIQDGNHGDFKRGEGRCFAVCFTPIAFSKTAEAEPFAIPSGDCRYDGCARVVFCGEKCWVIDFGLMAFADGPAPAGLRPGDMLAIDFFLEIDPYLYAEFLYEDYRIPPLRYHWRIENILRQTGPFINQRPKKPALTFGKNSLFRDMNRLGYEGIEKTDARRDDGGFAEYTLQLSLIDLPAER